MEQMTRKIDQNIEESSKKICHEHNKEKGKSCQLKNCRLWHDLPEYYNCTILASDKRRTLQSIGSFFGVTRMRICQIEKKAIHKLSKGIQKKI